MPLQSHYTLAQLLEACGNGTLSKRQLRRLLESNDVRFMRVGAGRTRVLLVPVDEIISKLPELWRSMCAIGAIKLGLT
jgi:hypothetical protein